MKRVQGRLGGIRWSVGARRSMHPSFPLLVIVAAIVASGCSGGAGDATPVVSSGGMNLAGMGKPSGRGTVVVTVRDGIGAPVPDADVRINTYWVDEDKRVVADPNGRAEIPNVIASNVSVTIFGPDSYAEMTGQMVSAGGVLSVEIIAQPTADAAGGIASAWVPAGGVSDDGQTLEFSLQIVQVPDAHGEYWGWGPDNVRVMGCTPDPGNDLPRYRADCVSGGDGFDAAYEGVTAGQAVSVRRVMHPSGAAAPAATYAAALLVDQSDHVIVNDPADARLFAAKYFLNSAGPDNRVALAAFASDDAASGEVSLLPQKPVSLFPIGNPSYTVDGRSLFATVDSLTTLEGGASPLFAAIDRMLDFAAANKTGRHNAVVVVTDGRDATCASRAECQRTRDALIQKSKATDVAIVTVGLANSAGDAEHETLGLLAQGAENGAAFWAPNPKQLAPILGSARAYLTDSKDLMEASFRIQSPVAGAFASGRTVLGQVRLEVCPFDCFYTFIPFAVRIP